MNKVGLLVPSVTLRTRTFAIHRTLRRNNATTMKLVHHNSKTGQCEQELRPTSVGLTFISTHADPMSGASLAWRLRRRISTVMFTCAWAWHAGWPIRPILGFWGAKFPKMWNSLTVTPMKRRAKCDAASFVLGREIRNRTNTHKQTNSNRYIHTLPMGMCEYNNNDIAEQSTMTASMS